MARIRTIKPEFWTSEQVMECSPNARLVFVGLWNFCDDGGNHPASAKTLKAEVLPGDDITSATVQGYIDELLQVGLLETYEAEGKTYWHVTGWHHQRIDQPSFKYIGPDGVIPEGAPKRRKSPNAPQAFAERSPNTSGENGGNSQVGSPNTRRTFAECSPPEGKGREGKGLINLNPPVDSAVALPTGTDGDGVQESLSGIDPPPDPIPRCPQEKILEIFAEILPSLPRPRIWEGARSTLLQTRWRLCAKGVGNLKGYTTQEQGVAFWKRFFEFVAKSKKLTEGIPRPDGSVWKPDLPWLLKAENFAKVIEKKYHDA